MVSVSRRASARCVDKDALSFLFQALYLFLIGGGRGPLLRHCVSQLGNGPLEALYFFARHLQRVGLPCLDIVEVEDLRQAQI